MLNRNPFPTTGELVICKVINVDRVYVRVSLEDYGGLSHETHASGMIHIKELKNGFGMRKMPSGCFEANALFFGIGVLAYNLFVTAKLLWFPKKYRKKTIKTIRWLLFEIAGRVIKQANKLFALYQINTFIKDDKIFLNLGNIEIEISKEEIKERAKQYNKLNIIK